MPSRLVLRFPYRDEATVSAIASVEVDLPTMDQSREPTLSFHDDADHVRAARGLQNRLSLTSDAQSAVVSLSGFLDRHEGPGFEVSAASPATGAKAFSFSARILLPHGSLAEPGRFRPVPSGTFRAIGFEVTNPQVNRGVSIELAYYLTGVHWIVGSDVDADFVDGVKGP